jgi:hypothetical protein
MGSLANRNIAAVHSLNELRRALAHDLDLTLSFVSARKAHGLCGVAEIAPGRLFFFDLSTASKPKETLG